MNIGNDWRQAIWPGRKNPHMKFKKLKLFQFSIAAIFAEEPALALYSTP